MKENWTRMALPSALASKLRNTSKTTIEEHLLAASGKGSVCYRCLMASCNCLGCEERVGEEVWAGEYRDGKRHGKLTCFSLA